MSVPALTNQAVQNVKDSSIVTAFVYLLLVSVVVLVARRLERRLAIPGVGASVGA